MMHNERCLEFMNLSLDGEPPALLVLWDLSPLDMRLTYFGNLRQLHEIS